MRIFGRVVGRGGTWKLGRRRRRDCGDGIDRGTIPTFFWVNCKLKGCLRNMIVVLLHVFLGLVFVSVGKCNTNLTSLVKSELRRRD